MVSSRAMAWRAAVSACARLSSQRSSPVIANQALGISGAGEREGEGGVHFRGAGEKSRRGTEDCPACACSNRDGLRGYVRVGVHIAGTCRRPNEFPAESPNQVAHERGLQAEDVDGPPGIPPLPQPTPLRVHEVDGDSDGCRPTPSRP